MHQLREGKDFYYNEQKLVVFTESYHLQRGYCCGNGCCHCPYNYSNVPLQNRNNVIAETPRHKDLPTP